MRVTITISQASEKPLNRLSGSLEAVIGFPSLLVFGVGGALGPLGWFELRPSKHITKPPVRTSLTRRLLVSLEN